MERQGTDRSKPPSSYLFVVSNNLLSRTIVRHNFYELCRWPSGEHWDLGVGRKCCHLHFVINCAYGWWISHIPKLYATCYTARDNLCAQSTLRMNNDINSLCEVIAMKAYLMASSIRGEGDINNPARMLIKIWIHSTSQAGSILVQIMHCFACTWSSIKYSQRAIAIPSNYYVRAYSCIPAGVIITPCIC